LQAKQFSEQLYAAQQTAAAHKAEAQQLQAKANSPMLSAFISFADSVLWIRILIRIGS
jgi:hypothetical protein